MTLTLRRLKDLGLVQERLGRATSITTLILATPYRSNSISVRPSAGREIASLPSVGPTHPVFGSQGLRGNQELTFNALDEYRQPLGRGVLVAVRKGHDATIHSRKGWRALASRSARGGQTPLQVARMTGQQVSTVRNHLRQLQAHDLARKINGFWYRLVFDPDKVAVEQGIADVPRRRKARHHADRLRYWEGRAQLPEDHAMAVFAKERDGKVVFVHPKTGEVLWETEQERP